MFQANLILIQPLSIHGMRAYIQDVIIKFWKAMIQTDGQIQFFAILITCISTPVVIMPRVRSAVPFPTIPLK